MFLGGGHGVVRLSGCPPTASRRAREGAKSSSRAAAGGCGGRCETRYYKTPPTEAGASGPSGRPEDGAEDFGELHLAKKVDKKIEEILLESGVINAQQAAAAVAEAESTGKRVGEALIEQGACKDTDVAKALAGTREVLLTGPVVELRRG